MLDSRFLCAISLLAACGDDGTCGTGGAAADGLLASANGVDLQYTSLTAGANGDCPDPSAPDVVPITIMGTQANPGMPDHVGFFTACIPRPDELAKPRAFGLSLVSDFQLVDVAGSDASCTYAIDRDVPPTGSATGAGVCDNGTNKAGFALTLDGAVTLNRTCGATKDTVTVSLKGTVAVTAQ